jgi:hypothetical protein
MAGERDYDDLTRVEFDYAWGWFQYHASQRLTAFNFFLIILGFLLVGFAQAIDKQWEAFGTCLGAIGAFVALGFLMLDIRNSELVFRGRDALKSVESKVGMDPLCDAAKARNTLPAGIGLGPVGRGLARMPWLFKHQLWLRSIIAFAGALFAAGGIWAHSGYPGADDPTTVSCRASTVLVLDRPGLDLNLVQRSEQQRDEGGSDDDRGGPGDGLSGYSHVQSVGMGDHKRVESGRHCGEEPVGGG